MQEFDPHVLEEKAVAPPEEFSKKARVDSMEEYQKLVDAARENPEEFWAEQSKLIEWFEPPVKTLEWNLPHAKWFVGGKLNVAHNCLDRHLEKNGERTNLRGWVFQVARNYLRDERKSARRHRTVALEREDSFADPQGSPERRTLDAERSRRLSAAIAKLPPHQRECVLLRASGLRYREIAQVLGIQIASVGAVVNRATARLREELS